MQDIQRKKSKVINLRGKGKKPIQVGKSVKVVVEEPKETEKIEPAKPKDWIGGEFPCIDCGLKEAIELGRCRNCDTQHQEVVKRLDSRPIGPSVERPPVQATYRKEVSQGVIVTIQSLEPLR